MFQKVFKEINVDSTGRAMAYLTLVYRTNHLTNEETVRQAVRLVVPVLRNNSGRRLYTEPLFVGGTNSFELMGLNVNSVNNLYNK